MKRSRFRYLVLAFDGVIFSHQWKDALWDRFCTGAPARQWRFVEQYNMRLESLIAVSKYQGINPKTVAKWKRRTPPCIPSRTNRKITTPHDLMLYRQRHKIENVFGRIKDWQRVATRYDLCTHAFMSVIP